MRRILATYPLLVEALVERLASDGVAADPEVWKERNEYYGWLARTDAAVAEAEAVVPRGSSYVIVDDDEWGASTGGGLLAERTHVPFLVRDGLYWGPPADDEAAVAALEETRRAGAEHVVFPWFSLWWLDHYRGFADTLRVGFPNETRREHLVSFTA